MWIFIFKQIECMTIIFFLQNIIISSGATNPFHVRGPYDIISLYPLNYSKPYGKEKLRNADNWLPN